MMKLEFNGQLLHDNIMSTAFNKHFRFGVSFELIYYLHGLFMHNAINLIYYIY